MGNTLIYLPNSHIITKRLQQKYVPYILSICVMCHSLIYFNVTNDLFTHTKVCTLGWYLLCILSQIKRRGIANLWLYVQWYKATGIEVDTKCTPDTHGKYFPAYHQVHILLGSTQGLGNTLHICIIHTWCQCAHCINIKEETQYSSSYVEIQWYHTIPLNT